MSLHLVTGYAGKAHVTSADQGAFNAGVVGTSEYVMGTGFQLSAQVISNNQIRIFDGDIMMQGRHICLKKDTYEDVAIANGLQGLNRNDLIVLRYTKDANTGVESIAFAVLQGVSTEGTASDPAHTTGDILGGECLLHEMPLYRVQLTGLNVGELVPLFTVVDSVAEVNSKIQTINDDLTTSNGTAFRFEYNAETGEYGYMAKVAGADTFFPFSNAKKLYEALQYSGLVTEDMTYDEICAVLAEEFPELRKVIVDGVLQGNVEQSPVSKTGAFSNESTVSDTEIMVVAGSETGQEGTVISRYNFCKLKGGGKRLYIKYDYKSVTFFASTTVTASLVNTSTDEIVDLGTLSIPFTGYNVWNEGYTARFDLPDDANEYDVQIKVDCGEYGSTKRWFYLRLADIFEVAE